MKGLTAEQIGKAHIDPRYCRPTEDGNGICDRVKILIISVPAKPAEIEPGENKK